MKAPLTSEELERFKEILALLVKAADNHREKTIRSVQSEHWHGKVAWDSAAVRAVYDDALLPYKRRPVVKLSDSERLFEAAFADKKERAEAIEMTLHVAVYIANPALIAKLIGDKHNVPHPSKPEDVDGYLDACWAAADKMKTEDQAEAVIQLLDMFKPEDDHRAADLEEAAEEENQRLTKSLEANNQALLQRAAAAEKAKKALADARALKAAGKPYTIPTYEDLMGGGGGP